MGGVGRRNVWSAEQPDGVLSLIFLIIYLFLNFVKKNKVTAVISNSLFD